MGRRRPPRGVRASGIGLALVGVRVEEHGEQHRQQQRSAHEQIGSPGPAGDAVQVADQPGAGERAQRAHAVDQRHGAAGDVGREDFRDDGEERSVGRVHAGPGQHQQGVGQPEVLAAEGVGTVEGDGRDEQRWPDETLAFLQPVRGPGHSEHGDHRRQVGQRRQPAGFDDVDVGAVLEDRRQPEDEAVDADAPTEILQREDDDLWRTERLAVVLHWLDALLLGGQGVFQVAFFRAAQPGGLARAVIHQAPPDEGPDHRRQAFDDEHPAPAEMLHQVAGDHRHPEDGHRVAEDQEGVRPRALGAGEPVAEVDQHRWHHRRLDHAEEEADADQQVDVGDHPGQGGQPAPEDQADEDQLLDAALFRVDRPRHLEEEVTEEEQRAQQRGQPGGDPQVVGHPGGGGEAVVGAVQVGQAVGDENDRHDVPPAAAGEARHGHGRYLLSLSCSCRNRCRVGGGFRRSCGARGRAVGCVSAAPPCRRGPVPRGCRSSCRAPPRRAAAGLPAAR